MDIHVISNGKLSLAKFAHIASQINDYVDYFHLREKHRPAAEIVEGVIQLLDEGIPPHKIIVNDRVDVAVAVNATGVQLAYNSLSVEAVKKAFPNLYVGKSIHSVSEAQEAASAGADYVLYGHVFRTASKAGLSARGITSLKEVVKSINIPVIAIGGIKPENVQQVVEAGVKGIAVMSGVLEAANPLSAIESYVMEGAKEK
ncbi:thiazole tautomerase TenI [Evansella halocellulosilytica]|uniref:thiazole tautomerase TenI n=1 Tax=Evansella halocellulosilytica TaxID=2011013 RepID=UPI000BB7CD5E|nr:thiazole tautomerase TenI [Evansella halocellulosilytica]